MPLGAFAVILSEQEEPPKVNHYCLFSSKRVYYLPKNLENGFLKDNIKKLHEHKRKRYRTQKVRHFSGARMCTLRYSSNVNLSIKETKTPSSLKRKV